MSDFETRLRVADPAAGLTYEHPNTDAMISRIIASTPRARRNVVRSFQLRMAGAVTMATVLTVAGIAVLENAEPALQILSLSATSKSLHTPTWAYKAATPASTMMRIYEEYNFSAGPGLSANGSSGPAYQLQLPANPSAEAARIATIFAVSGTPTDQNGGGSDWNVTDGSGNSLNYSNYGGVPRWNYNVSSTATSSVTSNGTSANVPNQATLDADVQHLLSKLGYGYQVADPQVSTSTVSDSGPGQATVTTNQEMVSYTVLVNGMSTDQTVQLSVDSNNMVLNASGPAFTLLPSVTYPLQSPVAGVAVLEALQKAAFATTSGATAGTGSGGGGAVAPDSSGSSPASAPAGAAGTAPTTIASTGTGETTTTTTSGPPIIAVTLDSVSLSLQSYQLTDGTVWLLPIYNYTGTVMGSNAPSYQGKWTTIAVDPAYIQLNVTSRGGHNLGDPQIY